MPSSSTVADIFTSPAVLTTLTITGISGFLLGMWSTSALSRTSTKKIIKLSGSRRKSKKSKKHHSSSSDSTRRRSADSKTDLESSASYNNDKSINLDGASKPGEDADGNDSDYTEITDSEDEEEEEDEDESPSLDAAPGAFAFSNEDCKMVLVIRTDLGMTKGKIIAQCAHAAVGCYKSIARSNPLILSRWERRGQAKITLKCTSEEELLTLQAVAISLDVTARVIQDAGRTQIDPGTRTVLGLGPAPISVINQVTGHLKLY